jgi:hypothetical protein
MAIQIDVMIATCVRPPENHFYYCGVGKADRRPKVARTPHDPALFGVAFDSSEIHFGTLQTGCVTVQLA